MGVPGLQSWLRRRYAEAFVPLPEGAAFDHVYIDMSSTLHQVIRRARTKSYFHYLLHRRLDELLAVSRPQKRVVLALDGPAPLAKLLEQRRRRKRESERAQRTAAAAAEASAAAAASSATGGPPPSGLTGGSSQQAWSSTVDALALQGGFRPPNPELSTLALTTGSRLMLEVHASLAAYICKKLADPATAHLSFEFSDSTVKGEGELKILSRLLHTDAVPDGAAAWDETHLVLGGDSDLLLMALVAGQRGVYILSDKLEGDHNKGKQHRRRGPGPAAPDDRTVPAAPAASSPAAAARPMGVGSAPVDVVSSVDGLGAESSSSEVDSDSESEEDKEGGAAAAAGLPPGLRLRRLPELAAAAAVAAPSTGSGGGQDAATSLVAFSRDAAEQLWREQHLAGVGEGQAEVTGLALDLMLLSTMCSGNDYLPAIQGMQLSNKHRPGLWDLYCAMRLEPRWQGQVLVQRGCACGGTGAGSTARDCPSVSLNWDMVLALLAEYHRQRFVFLEGPHAALAAAPGDAIAASQRTTASDAASSTTSGGGGGALLGSSSLSSVDLPEGGAMVWGEEGLAAAAAAAGVVEPGGGAAGGGPGPGAGQQQRGSKGPSVALRGLDAEPDSYLQGLEWVLQMYCSGAVRDYRFTYDLAAPSLPHLLDTLHLRVYGHSTATGSSTEASGSEAATGSGISSAGALGSAGSSDAGRDLNDGEERRQQHVQAPGPGVPRWRSTQPLVPAACAMALLPRGGRMHAATALQHLMDEGGQLDDIYATCDDCMQLGVQLGSMGRELDGARAELASAQLQLGELATEALAGEQRVAPAVELLQGEVEHLEAELARLKLLMSALSRSQQEHMVEAHPYKPFPTEELEAAVAAVPLASYPRRERKLAQFGREFVFRRMRDAGHDGSHASDGQRLEPAVQEGRAGSGLTQPEQREAQPVPQSAGLASAARHGEGEQLGVAPVVMRRPDAPAAPWLNASEPLAGQDAVQRHRLPLQPWVLDCVSFAAAYPRVADPLSMRRTGVTVERDVLPLRPYMQPPQMQSRGDGTALRPSALLARCQLMRWGQQQHAAVSHPRPHHNQGLRRSGTLAAHPSRAGPLQAPAAAAALQQGQRSQLHTMSQGGGGAAGRAAMRAQLSCISVRSGLLSRLLGNLRMLRAF